MSEPTCETCKFWDDHDPETDGDGATGDCRRRSPVLVPFTLRQLGINNDSQPDEFVAWDATAFPVTPHWEWCGDHEPKPSTVPQIVGSLPDHPTTNES